MSVRVLITRENAEPLSRLIASAGGTPVHAPLIELNGTGAAPPHFAPDAVLVTSASVLRFVPDLARYLEGARVVAVGTQTGVALKDAGIEVSDVGSSGGLEAYERLDLQPGEAGWYVGALKPSRRLDEAMGSSLARWSVYETNIPSSAKAALDGALPCDVLTFCSGSAVRGFATFAIPHDSRVVVLGASTAAAVEKLGWTVHAVAKSPDLPSLVKAALI